MEHKSRTIIYLSSDLNRKLEIEDIIKERPEEFQNTGILWQRLRRR